MPGKGQGGGKPGGGGGGDDGGVNQINGKKKADTLFGTDGQDIIFGRDGDDTLWGLGDTDQLIGGNGSDTLFGGDGDDSLHGGNDDDFLYGGAGSDLLQGGEGADVMDGGPGPTGSGDDSDEVTGDHDVASFVEVAPTYDAVNEEYIGLTIQGSSDASFDYETSDGDKIVNVEEIRGTNYNDTMIGTSGDDYYVGARGEDTISGYEGDDTLYGSLDDDVVDADEHGGTGSDTLVFLRYNTDGVAGADPDALGDGNDIVTGFDPSSDKILFLGNEDFTGTASLEMSSADGGVSTLITYASDSSILLQGVAFSTAITVEFELVDL